MLGLRFDPSLLRTKSFYTEAGSKLEPGLAGSVSTRQSRHRHQCCDDLNLTWSLLPNGRYFLKISKKADGRIKNKDQNLLIL